ncbi:MAG: 3-isopropylmalate dehydrogenase [Myxococcales bacterium]|nr:3-isopropylmalate dehydrogenase [Myxococcales bacterium]
MSTLKVLVLEGDGIGQEVTTQAVQVLQAIADWRGLNLELEYSLFGGASIDDCGEPLTQATTDLAKAADAVLLGAVGGPKWDDLPTAKRPERGLLGIRKALGLYANLRPAKLFPALASACPLKPERASRIDFIVVRELVGGIYFGEPRGIDESATPPRGFNTLVYDEDEVRRIAKVGFELARSREGRLISIDKSNVLESMALWRRVVIDMHTRDYSDVELSHLYVDNAAMQLILNPSQFDVAVTGNMFGDIISDAAAALTGSIGMLPSASLGEGTALYEPVHGSAPDIAGKGIANPLAAIQSVAMLLEHSAGDAEAAKAIYDAVEATLNSGLRTGDLKGVGEGDMRVVGTEEMGQAVLRNLSL